MFIDVHSHHFRYPAHFTGDFKGDYPFTAVHASAEGMRRLNCMLEGTALPRLDSGRMEEMFERDTPRLLGIG